jgi:hypothetical protein
MKKFSKLLCFMVVFISVMAGLCTVSFAAKIGDQLNSPEAGWQRYDDSDSYIKYVGSGWQRNFSTTLNYYNNSAMANYILP